MSNTGSLINSSSLVSGRAALEGLREQPGHVDGEVASCSNRLLIPWLLCFRRSDLRPLQSDFIGLQLPCTTVAQAVCSLEQSLPVFEAITGDSVLARAYWTLACALLRRLPLPYLTMDPTEILQLSSARPETLAETFVGALSGDLAAIPHLKSLTRYDDSVPPYPLDVLYSIPSGDKDEARLWNASVLDGGFQPSLQFVRWHAAPGTASPIAPAPPPSSIFGELHDVPDLLKAWVMEEGPFAAGAELSLWSGEPHDLQGEVYARSIIDARRLESSATLGPRLRQLGLDRLEPWCRKHGFDWIGFRYSSPAWARS